MYRKAIVVFFIGLMVMSLIPSIKATDPDVMELGTMAYKGSKMVNINQSHDVDIVIIYTPIPNGISFRKVGYNRLTNTTIYNFESKTVSMEYGFKNDTKPSFYMDITTRQLYRISIDYRNATVPLNPLSVPYSALFMKYNNTYANFTKTNASLLNMTEKQNKTYNQLLVSSLNESLAQNRANSLARDKRNLEDSMFRTQIVAVLLMIFFSVLAVFLARKFGWLTGNPNRKLKRMETGYGPFAKTMDRYIKKKNDDITLDKKENKQLIQQQEMRQNEQLPTVEQSLERTSVKRYPVSPAIQQEFDQMMLTHDSIQKTLEAMNKKLDKKKE